MTATYQDLVSNGATKDAIKLALDLATGFGEVVKSVGLLNIAIGLLAIKFLPLKLAEATVLKLIPAFGAATTGAKALTLAMNALIPIAIIGTIIGVVKLIDHFSTSLSEQKQKVDDLTSSLSQLNSEYDALKNKTYLTEEENKRLQLLEKEIILQEKLQKIESDKKNKMLVQSFTGEKDEGSIFGKVTKGKVVSDLTKTNKLLDEYKQKKKDIKEIDDKVAKDNISVIEKGKLLEEKTKLQDSMLEIEATLSKTYSEKGLAELVADEYDDMSDKMKTTITKIEKILGLTTNYEDRIKDATSSFDVLNEASDKVNASMSFTKEEMDDLITAYPSLESSVTQVGDAYYLEANAFNEATEASRKNAIDSLTFEKQKTLAVLQNAKARLGIMVTETTMQAEFMKALLGNQYAKASSRGVNLTDQQKKDLETYNRMLSLQRKIEALGTPKLTTESGIDTTGVGDDSKDKGEDKYKEAFEKEYKELQYWRDKGWITEEDYYKKLIVLNDRYFKGRLEYIDDYRQYELEAENGLTQVYQAEVDRRLEISKAYIEERNFYNDWGADSEIEAWKRVNAYLDEYYKSGKIKSDYYTEKVKENNRSIHTAQIKALELEKGYYESALNAVNDVIDKQIEKLEEKKQLIEDTNKAVEDAITLEKLQESLENAKREKTIRIYSEATGWVKRMPSDIVIYHKKVAISVKDQGWCRPR